jgi:prevent-host-death family protein
MSPGNRATAMSTTNAVGAYGAKTHFSQLLEKLEAGEEITITKHGTPVARLVPIKKNLTTAARRKIIDDWINRPDRPTLGGLKISDLIKEGRR